MIRTPTPTLRHLSILLLAALGPLLSLAQQNVVYLAFDHEPVSTELKFMAAAVDAIDPAAVLSVEGAQVKVRTSAHAQELLHAFGTAGISGLTLNATRAMEVAVPLEFQKTGDPAMDEAAYKAAKDAWIAAHPEAYRSLNTGTTRTGAPQQPQQ